jgi:hypothetical protein
MTGLMNTNLELLQPADRASAPVDFRHTTNGGRGQCLHGRSSRSDSSPLRLDAIGEPHLADVR